MFRLFSGLLLTAFLMSGSMLAASAGSSSMKSTSSHSMTTKKSCPAGQTWVKGYKTKDGKTVKGYCRKK